MTPQVVAEDVQEPTGAQDRAVRLSRSAAALVITIGMLVLLGWLFDVTLLKSVSAGIVSMKANTALAFVCAGVGCLLATLPWTNPRLRHWRTGTAAAALALGALTLLEWTFGLQLGIDQLLFRDDPRAIGTIFPGRMAPWTALNFVLFGAALLLLDVRDARARSAGKFVTVLGFLPALLSFLGYLFGVADWYGGGLNPYIAVHTSIAFLLLGVGILAARPERLSYRSAMQGYGSPLLAVALAFLVRLVLWPVLHGEVPFVLHWPAIFLAAWIGGFQAGLLATLLSAFGIAFFMLEPRGSLAIASPPEEFGVIMFVLLGSGLSFFVARVRQAERARFAVAMESQAVRAVSAYHRSLIEGSPDPLLTMSLDGKVGDVNAALEAATGYPRDQLLGTDFTNCFTEPDRVRQLHVQVQRDGTVRGVSLELRQQDGHTIPVLYSAAVLRDPAGLVNGVVATLRDITERLQAEAALRASEERFRRITVNMQDMVSQSDLAGVMQYASPSHFPILGYQPDQLEGKCLFEFVHPDDRPGVRALFAESQHTRRQARYEVRFRHADGHFVWLETVGNVVLDEKGAPVAVVLTSRDVTQRRHREAELRRLWQAIEQSPISIVITDAQANIEYVNPHFTRTTGYTLDEVRGRNPRVLKSGVQSPAFYADLWATLRAGREWHGEFCNRTKSGALYWEQASISPVRDLHQQTTHYIAVKEDITAARQEALVRELLHDVDARLLQGEPLPELLRTACCHLARVFPMSTVWISQYDATGTVSLQVGSDDTPEALAGWQALLANGNLPAQVFRSGVFQAGAADAAAALASAGVPVDAVVSLPLQARGVIHGVLTIMSRQNTRLDAGVLEHLGGELGGAIERFHVHEQLRLQGVALSTAANAVLITDYEGRIHWANAAFSRLSGYVMAELEGLTPRILKSGKHDASFYGSLWKTIQEGDVWVGEITERRKDGSLYVVNQTITPLRDGAGAITNFVAIHEDITARKEAETRLDHLAHHDVLTDLPNRALFQGYLPVAVAQARRAGHLLGLLFLDLDNFKLVNDTLGHGMGDLLLKAVAERLRRSVRATDLVARLGGDEFAIVLPELRSAGVGSDLARKLLALLAEPYNLDGRQVFATASIGITLCPLDSEDADRLIQNADLAMYRAKKEGRSTYQFFAAEMNVEAQRRRSIENDLRLALERDEFVLHYQPVVQLGTRQLVGLEALVRWQHPQRGLLGPGEFIGVAEESGLIAPLGQWVLRAAARQCQAWRDAGLPAVRLAVNASMFQFRHADMVQAIAQILEETGLPARFLGLELTESMLMQNLAVLAGDLRRLHDLGIELSIDDFGTGYSSLAYLQQLPVDRLKIDRSFVRDLAENASSVAIIRAIIALGHSLGLRVLAEGVETAAQLDFLSKEGCDEFQGYYLSVPVPAAAVPPLLTGAARPSHHALRTAPVAAPGGLG